MKTLLELLNTTNLKHWYDKTQELAVLNTIWRIVVPEMKDYCQIANFEGGHLVLAIHNSSLATKVRFELPEIKKKLLQYDAFADLCKIRYKVIYETPQKNRVIKKRRLTKNSASTLIKAASSIENPLLKKSLKKLAASVKAAED